jgi:hypothetical protein
MVLCPWPCGINTLGEGGGVSLLSECVIVEVEEFETG